MLLRGIDFGYVLGASLIQGFFGEGYAYHTYFKPLGLRFDALDAREGNMPLKEDGYSLVLWRFCVHGGLQKQFVQSTNS